MWQLPEVGAGDKVSLGPELLHGFLCEEKKTKASRRWYLLQISIDSRADCQAQKGESEKHKTGEEERKKKKSYDIS